MTHMTSILYLDNDEGRRDTRTKILIDAGYRIFEACTEKEAVLMSRALHPELVVLAGATPRLAAQIRQVFEHDSTYDRPLLLLVTATPDGNVDHLPSPGDPADSVLKEPVSLPQFLAVVHALVRLTHSRKENRRLVEQLHQTERRLSNATEAAGCGLWDWEIRTGRLEWYGMQEQLAGMLPEGFNGKIEAFIDVLRPDDRERVWQRLRATMARRESRFVEEYRFVQPDGSVHWMQGTGKFFYDAQGAAVRMTGVVQDISERKQAEEALRKIEQQQRILINGVRDYAIFMLDSDGSISSWNDEAERVLGYKAEDIVGQYHGVLYPDEAADGPMQALRLASTQGRCERDERRVRKDGSQFLANVIIAALRDVTDDARGFAVVLRDITEKKEAECRLAFYRTIIEASTDAVAIIDHEARYVEQNEAHRNLLGYTDEELIGQRPTLHTDDPTYECVMSSLSATGRFEGEIVSIRKDGTPVDIEMKVFPVKDGTGAPLYFVGIKRDVTARKQAERALRESEERFHTLADNISQFAWMADASGSIFWYNRRWFDYTGTTLDEMKGWGWTAVHHPDHVERVVARIQRAWDSGEPWEDTFPLRSANGTYRWFLSRAVPIRDDEGRILRWFGTNTDVTELRETEEALRRREKQLRIVTDSVPSLISYVDREERYRFVNAGYENMFGLPRHEIIGRSARELLGDTYADIAPYVRRVLSGEAVLFESDLVYVGASHAVQVSYTPDVSPDGTVAGFYVLVTDISGRKRQENELRRWKDELEIRVAERTQELVASQERLRALASQLSLTEQRERRKLARDLHDYLAQLLVVGGMKIGLARKSLALTPAGAVLVQELDDIVQQSLGYTRTMIAELSPPALHDAGLPAALRWLGERMQKDGLWVEVSSDREELALPEDRAVFVFQSVRELLFNVLKHAGVDRATVSIRSGPGGALSVVVEDCGKGMDDDALRRSVEPGHFGLLSVQERMEAMGGWLEIGPRTGGGTRVELGLPHATPDLN